MNRDYVIIGNGSFAYMLYKYIKEDRFGNVIAFVADKDFIDDTNYKGIPIMDFASFLKKIDTSIPLIMGIGYSRMGTVREEKYKYCKAKGYSFVNYIHSSSKVHSTAKLGEGNVIFENVDIQADAKIGDCNLFLAGSFFGHDSVAENYNTFCVKSVVTGFVEIKNNCFIGTLATMNNKIVIDNFTFLGATAFASRSTRKNTVVVPDKCKYIQVDEGGYLI